MNSSIFWVITRRKVVWNRRFRTTSRVPSSRIKLSKMKKETSSCTVWHLKIRPIGSPETSVSNHFTPRNNPEVRGIRFKRGRNPVPRKVINVFALTRRMPTLSCPNFINTFEVSSCQKWTVTEVCTRKGSPKLSGPCVTSEGHMWQEVCIHAVTCTGSGSNIGVNQSHKCNDVCMHLCSQHLFQTVWCLSYRTWHRTSTWDNKVPEWNASEGFTQRSSLTLWD